jgi:hypothetical protein
MEEHMRASASRSVLAATIASCLAIAANTSARANVITDWDEKAVAAVAPLASFGSSPYTPYVAYRMMGIVHVAMFDAVNSIERRRAGRQVPLQLLATDHGNSQWRYRRQPCHGA